MTNLTIPPKSRPEWAKMINGTIVNDYKNYVLQTRTYQMQKDIASGKIKIEQAIDELHELCSKYSLAVQKDFQQIFKTW